MRFDFIKFYHYIFDDWADIEKYIIQKFNCASTDQIREKITNSREKIANRKKQEIRNFFAQFKPSNPEQFRVALRLIGNIPLELILFGNVTDVLTEDYSIPSSESIRLNLLELDRVYNYFGVERLVEGGDLARRFEINYLLCMFINDFYKHTIAEDLNAYKILVIFYDADGQYFSKFDRFVRINLQKIEYSINDTLPYDIPKNSFDNPLQLGAWVELIQTKGMLGLRLFSKASEIEKALNYSQLPKIKSLLDVAIRVCYKQAAVNPLLAHLCFYSGVSEEYFNLSLQLVKLRKSNSHLPNVLIDGGNYGNRDYALALMPLDDPHIYTIGFLSKSCLKLFSHGSKCLESAIINPYTDIYVLLKRKKNTSLAKPIIDGRINYFNFDIVGSGYSWISKNGNIVIDSWENKFSSDDKITVTLLKAFAEFIVSQPSNKVNRVSIGTGGQTPRALLTPSKYSEFIYSGISYRDSDIQHLLCSTIGLANQAIAKQIFSENTIGNSPISMIVIEAMKGEQIDVDLLYSLGEKGLLKYAISQVEMASFNWNKVNALKIGLIFKSILVLNECELINNTTIIDWILNNPMNSHVMANILASLKKANMLCDTNLDWMLANHTQAIDVSRCLLDLKKHDLYNQQNRNLALTNPQYSYEIMHVLRTFKELNILEEFYDWIISNLHKAQSVASALFIMARHQMPYKKILPFLIEHPDQAEKIEKVVIRLNSNSIYDDVFLELMLKFPERIERCVSVLCGLKDRGLFNNIIREWVLSYPRLIELELFNQIILLIKQDLHDHTNLDWISNHVESMKNMVSLLLLLKEAKLYSNRIRNLIFSKDHCILPMLKILNYLKLNRLTLSEYNLVKIINYADYIKKISFNICKLPNLTQKDLDHYLDNLCYIGNCFKIFTDVTSEKQSDLLQLISNQKTLRRRSF